MLITDFLFLGKFWCRLLQTPSQDILNYICSFPSFHFKLYRRRWRGLFLTFPLQYVKWWKIVLLNNLSDNNNCLWTRILIQFQAEPKKLRSFVFTVLHLSVWNYGKSYLGNDVDVDDGKVPISFGSESPQY